VWNDLQQSEQKSSSEENDIELENNPGSQGSIMNIGWRHMHEPLGINDLEMQTMHEFTQRSMDEI